MLAELPVEMSVQPRGINAIAIWQVAGMTSLLESRMDKLEAARPDTYMMDAWLVWVRNPAEALAGTDGR